MRLKLISLGLLIFLVLLCGCSSTDPYPEDAYFKTIHSDHINLGGAPLLIPACGEMYITTSVNTTLTLINTYYKSLGTTMAGEERGFTSLNAGRMTYNDITPNRICLITGAMAIKADTPNVIVTAKLFINDEPHNSSAVQTKLLASGDIDVLTMIALATLQPGDYIEVWIKANKANVVVTLDGMDFTATTVD